VFYSTRGKLPSTASYDVLQNNEKRARSMVQVVVCLPGKYRVLSSNPNTTKKKAK
jgi:hypothetical protein